MSPSELLGFDYPHWESVCDWILAVLGADLGLKAVRRGSGSSAWGLGRAGQVGLLKT